jgi:hypothetical protein
MSTYMSLAYLMAFFRNEARSGGDMVCDRLRVASTAGDIMIAMNGKTKKNNNGEFGAIEEMGDERGKRLVELRQAVSLARLPCSVAVTAPLRTTSESE